MSEIIKVQNLVKDYGELRAVDHISFSVKTGEIFGFLGPNGAGKTTTIKILCSLLKPTDGTAEIDGIDVVRDPAKIRKQIGLVFQTSSLDDRLTGYENLRFHSVLYDVPAKLSKARIEELAERVGLENRINDKVKEYSGGMKRRLELIRGLIHRPKVLFLDEPTLGLDPQTRRLIWEYVDELQKTDKRSIFLTTHYMDEVESADRVAIIDNGKIVAMDTVPMLKNGLGGDLVTLEVEDSDTVSKEIQEKFNIDVTKTDSGLRIMVDEGAQFIPKLIATLSMPIHSIDLHAPTMDDVFLELTGHEIREEQPEKVDVLGRGH